MFKNKVKLLGICVIGLITVFYFTDSADAGVFHVVKGDQNVQPASSQALMRLEGNYREEVGNVNLLAIIHKFDFTVNKVSI